MATHQSTIFEKKTLRFTLPKICVVVIFFQKGALLSDCLCCSDCEWQRTLQLLEKKCGLFTKLLCKVRRYQIVALVWGIVNGDAPYNY